MDLAGRGGTDIIQPRSIQEGFRYLKAMGRGPPGLALEALTPHCSTLAWKIPWMEEPGRLQSMGSLRIGHN